MNGRADVDWWGPDAPPSDGWRVIQFAEAFCRYTRGPNAGQLVQLRTWQKVLILEIFELDEDGNRLYRRGLLGLPRKNGKSLLGAIIALYCLVADGENGAEVYSVAGDRDQARVVFDEVMKMVNLEPELKAVLKVRDAQATILHPASGSLYRALASDSATAEGLNPSCVIFDEVHVQRNGKLWAVMTNGSATRSRAIVLGITTAGYDLSSLCGRLYKMGKKGSALGFYFRWWEPEDPACDFRDEKVWHETNPGLGDFQHIEDFRVACAEASEGGSENDFRRYRLNQWTGSVEAWLGYQVWERLRGGEPLEDGDSVVLGFDGSFSGDSTGIVACSVGRDLPHLAKMRLWSRPEGAEGAGWRVPIDQVEDEIRALCRRFDVREVVCDPYRWQRSMQVLQDEGIPIVEFPTASPARMVPATTTFTDAVLGGLITHDGDPDFARHVQNARLKSDAKGPRITKEHGNSANKIDLAVCAVIALDRALRQDEDDEDDDSLQIW